MAVSVVFGPKVIGGNNVICLPVTFKWKAYFWIWCYDIHAALDNDNSLILKTSDVSVCVQVNTWILCIRGVWARNVIRSASTFILSALGQLCCVARAVMLCCFVLLCCGLRLVGLLVWSLQRAETMPICNV